MRVEHLAAAVTLAGSLLWAADANASEWGCKVVLCLSNPGGPTEYSECRPPIEKLWKHLAKGGSFPT
jgi:hypothetical protein